MGVVPPFQLGFTISGRVMHYFFGVPQQWKAVDHGNMAEKTGGVRTGTLPLKRMAQHRLSGSWTKTVTETNLKDPERQDLPE